ncbi:4-phosphoerythronate dehydrogenase [Congregibacter variabilis]|uniref:Erythronate-4-phosphate dehydrogenase n=1 Tax=Congregibacter variabilis TaxID=3081200 RepID=A0ABZ0I4P8_9GAMM|nr:4-phosphoerythronate dehydrogenase [Congregibacter sp. IMCC43200]
MIRVLADENMVGLDLLPKDEMDIHTVPGRTISKRDLDGVDVLWVRSVTQVSEALVDGSKLRFVGTATAGLEHIDQEALKKRGIGFSAAPGANANSVVEYVLAALAELQEPWERLEGGETLGIVGCGSVGRLFASVAQALGWNVKVHDPWLAQGNCSPDWASFAEILQCRVISLHCSLTREQPWPSYHLFDAPALAALNGSQWLINAARGSVIDNSALLEHLSGEDPVNCVLDVWEGEPAFNTALLASPALKFATAHIAGYSWDAKWQATRMLYSSLLDAQLLRTPLPEGLSSSESLAAVSGTGSDLARQLISQRYSIKEDDLLFRQLTSLGAQRAAGFDALRRTYRQRRELRGSELIQPRFIASRELSGICAALGISLREQRTELDATA